VNKEVVIKNIIAEMGRQGVDGKTLASHAKISPMTVSRIINGLTEPKPATLGKIASGLGVDVGELLKTDE
jgi:transcriptional regulator with XRE-family HTH domain